MRSEFSSVLLLYTRTQAQHSQALWRLSAAKKAAISQYLQEIKHRLVLIQGLLLEKKEDR